MALLIKTDGTAQQILPADKTFSLEELYQHVGCLTVEYVRLADGRGMWLDEEGKLSPLPYRKHINIVATLLLYEAGGSVDDFIVGDVLITNPDEVE